MYQVSRHAEWSELVEIQFLMSIFVNLNCLNVLSLVWLDLSLCLGIYISGYKLVGKDSPSLLMGLILAGPGSDNILSKTVRVSMYVQTILLIGG
jgi:hypothetical protein